ncbi:cytochrome o ubiquinol oxidase subunit IV [Larsenimonas suaedae]|uniref:Cytochrome bo(3) ubiquinol oxidase subunit 4 n=1 Tax=Larsenimonas suaedae TaxID=1851019 RepID=A0ABU1GTX5_9GAMM|nr:cytochrome o ubiquinol oxidase subunit IV [Larsenimonas suaedae]MCM2971925.1 cytochrome o ubiquinol oxidase subunit IV [Larsenimonas suaedae]MDR5895477.1 cytochrome o ubiquinol oxidase subunit IV [Larsenimonas suaedae]
MRAHESNAQDTQTLDQNTDQNTQAQQRGHDDEDLARERQRDFRSYGWGLFLSLVLTLIPFGVAAFVPLPSIAHWIIIGECAVVQIIVHFRFFLHISFSRNTREDLQLILFTVLIITILAGGTLWILFDLYYRMMPGMAP